MVHTFVRLEDQLARIERLGLFAVFAGLVLMLFLQVIFRYVIEQPLASTEELARILFIWLVFLGAAYGSYTSQHFLVGFIFGAFPIRFQRVVGPMVDLLTILFLAVLLWVGWNTAMGATVQRFPVLGLPVMIQVMALPVGSGLMIFHTLMLVVRRRAGIPFATLDFTGDADKLLDRQSNSSDKDKP